VERVDFEEYGLHAKGWREVVVRGLCIPAQREVSGFSDHNPGLNIPSGLLA